MKKVIALFACTCYGICAVRLRQLQLRPASSDSSAKKEALTFTTGGEAGTYYAFGSVLLPSTFPITAT